MGCVLVCGGDQYWQCDYTISFLFVVLSTCQIVGGTRCTSARKKLLELHWKRRAIQTLELVIARKFDIQAAMAELSHTAWDVAPAISSTSTSMDNHFFTPPSALSSHVLDLHDFFEQCGRDVGPGRAEEKVDQGAEVSRRGLLQCALVGDRSGVENGLGFPGVTSYFISCWAFFSLGGALEEGSRYTPRHWDQLRCRVREVRFASSRSFLADVACRRRYPLSSILFSLCGSDASTLPFLTLSRTLSFYSTQYVRSIIG
jgi:hypothetical protein